MNRRLFLAISVPLLFDTGIHLNDLSNTGTTKATRTVLEQAEVLSAGWAV